MTEKTGEKKQMSEIRLKSNAKKPVTPVTKPFLQGTVTDENTWKNALVFFGIVLVVAFMTFLVCSMTGFESVILRVLLNGAIIVMTMFIYYTRGVSLGTEAVARGETMYQRREKGLPVAESEIRICYHPLKGYVTALLGVVPVLILTLMLAFMTTKQTTTAGALPGWMSIYLRRSEVGDALVGYTQTRGMTFVEILRIIVRLTIMPWVSIVGTADRDAILWVERLSPLITLLPVIAYGFGYTRGVHVRTKVHTEIAENTKRRQRQENRRRKKARGISLKPKEPQQLN